MKMGHIILIGIVVAGIGGLIWYFLQPATPSNSLIDTSNNSTANQTTATILGTRLNPTVASKNTNSQVGYISDSAYLPPVLNPPQVHPVVNQIAPV